eukprot:261243-Ditylum_brightwellii.AAC.1
MSTDIHSDVLEDVKSVVDRFTTKNHLKEVMHQGLTHRNKGVNNSTNAKAPKTRVYCSSSSLNDRVHRMIGLHHLGHQQYYVMLFAQLGINVGESMIPKVKPKYAAVPEKIRNL